MTASAPLPKNRAPALANDLVSLAHSKTPEHRQALLHMLLRAFLARPDHYNETELSHFDAILSRLLSGLDESGHADGLSPLARTQLFLRAPQMVRRQILLMAETIAKGDTEADTQAEIEDAISFNREQIERALARGVARLSNGGSAHAERFIQERISIGAINESLLKTLIAENRMNEFMFAFSYCVGVNLVAGRAILRDLRFEALAIACRACGLERQTFAKIVVGLQQRNARDNYSPLTDRKNALHVLDLYAKTPRKIAEKLMRFWRIGNAPPSNQAPQKVRSHKDGVKNDVLELRRDARLP